MTPVAGMRILSSISNIARTIRSDRPLGPFLRQRLRGHLRTPLLTLRRRTCRLRRLPEFAIIGAQKSGTTSLYRYICDHPAVLPAFSKEVHFYDLAFDRGIEWYRAHFPTDLHRRLTGLRAGSAIITGEASPYYLYHPLVPERMTAVTPEIRLIAILRDPVERAYSHWKHEVALCHESLAFREAIEREPERLRSEHNGSDGLDAGRYGYHHEHHSYLARGVYADQIERWLEHFDRSRLLILGSEDLGRQPRATMARVYGFLGLPEHRNGRYPLYNRGPRSTLEPPMRRRLERYYEPHDARLEQLLGRKTPW